ncbi:hypothetical protein K458DRAFT_376381 [Lentithecium fluviatile CBS 122367]|uniref:DUF4211 domain-containing protein n=1 Tax=Lentithecium fluviatile CBS 122367 TaxID=1168545 RepID=A0A6G1IJT7_9PLEO|nr:hypothetical protein K458DRAFT_376381 [Lentithecium fluviatile CBS 122367]
MPPKRSLTRKRQTKINFSPATQPSPQKHLRALSLSSDDDEASPSRPAKRRKLEKETQREVARAPQASSSRRKDKQAGKSKEGPKSRSSRRQAARRPSTPTESEEDDEEKDQAPRSSEARRHRQPTEDSESEDPQPKHPRRRNGQRASTPEETQTKSNRRKATQRTPTPEQESINEDEEEGGDSYDENDELKEELAFLKSSPLPDRGRLRSTHDKPKTEREKALEALKKRRGGTTEPSSSATPSRKKPVVIESDSESELDVIKEEEDEIEDIEDEDEAAKEDDEESTTNTFNVFQENAEDEGFIDDDDDDDALIGAPAEHTSMPLEFSSLSRAKPRELFKYAIEWMVQKKINPAFAADDEIYDLTFRKLNDEVNGLANSKFHSSVWTPDFTRAIRARPDLIVNEIGHHMRTVLEPHCEACNRKNHVATWEASLTGTPYDKDTLEPLADDSDSSSENESDNESSLSSHPSSAALNGEKATYDATGERIPPESKFFALGSTCKANAQVAHTLYHWRYHLNSWVVDYLVNEGHCTPEKLVKRDKWSVKKRMKYANKIVDKMEREGEVRKLHRLYKEQVDFAMEAKNEYTRGWGRRG